jgi:pyruvate formate lyase activating enzyme
VVAARTLHPAPPESYTIFTAGCNFKCLHCQNWSISQFPDNRMPVEGCLASDLLAADSVRNLRSPSARLMGADRIFFSGGEPTIHLPFIEKVVEEARRLDPTCKVNFDTNGFMTEQSLERVLRFTTSITFDIKAFHDDTHRALTGAPVDPVLRNAEIVARNARDRLWEYRIVVIPKINEDDIAPICQFVAGISKDLPVCFLAFRPNFVLEDHPGASLALMRKCVELAKEAGIRNAYWSGAVGIRGSSARPPVKDAVSGYERAGAELAASYALARGCRTHPRHCRGCESSQQCPIKTYIPTRSC